MKTTGKAVSRKWLRWFVGASAAVLLAVGDAQAVTYKVLHSFCREANCTDGAVPYGELLLDASGDLYGTAARGGDIDAGALFQLRRDTDTGRWKYKTLYSFCSKPYCN